MELISFSISWQSFEDKVCSIELSFLSCSLWLLALKFNILWQSLNVKCTSSFLSLFLVIFDFRVSWWSSSAKPCNFWCWFVATIIGCCSSWNSLLTFLAPCNFWCWFIATIIGCCRCWNGLLTFLAPCDFWSWFIVAIDGCYNCWNISPIWASIVSIEIQTHLITTPLHQPTS